MLLSRKTTLHGAFFVLAMTYAWMMLWVAYPDNGRYLEGLIIRKPAVTAPKWVTITEQQVDSGATIPAETNVVFHLPLDMRTVTRSVLLGRFGRQIRYWGYCFPEEYVPDPRREGLPGKVFLSEAERKWRADRLRADLPTYSIYNLPSQRQTELSPAAVKTIRHQMERFAAGMTCYIMTERALPIGTDRDGDGINVQQEKQYKTDPNNADTDGDGITDGLELTALLTDPLVRDSDGDGLIEGFEDRNRNGIVDTGETHPLKYDTDYDGLCDGYCRISNTKKVCRDLDGRDCVLLPYNRWMGEDKNLNGMVDTGETDPKLTDTDNDRILDDQEYFNCVLDRKANC